MIFKQLQEALNAHQPIRENEELYMSKTAIKSKQALEKFLTPENFGKKRDQIIQLLATQMSAYAVKQLGFICIDDDNSTDDIKLFIKLAVKTLQSLGVKHVVEKWFSEESPWVVAYVDEKPQSSSDNTKPRISIGYENRKWVISSTSFAAGHEHFSPSRISGTETEKAIDVLIKKTKSLQDEVKKSKGQ